MNNTVVKKSRQRQFKYVFVISGTTDFNQARRLYFINSHTQGMQMCEFAWSVATELKTLKDCNHYIAKLKEKFLGIKSYKIEYRKVELI